MIALVALMLWAMTRPGAAAFYMTTSEVAGIGRIDQVTQPIRVNGKVVPGSIATEGIETTFVISDGRTPLEVKTDAPLPDTFRDRSEVVALGRPVGDEGGVAFLASEVLAKCPSKFKAAA